MAVADRIRAVESVLDDPGVATDGELIEALQEVERAQTELALRLAGVTAECDRRMLFTEDGSRSTVAWLARRCDLRRGEAAARVREARNLERMPETVAAAEAGELSASKVSLLARARRDRLAAEFDRVEPTLVAEAKRLRCDDLARFLKRWEHLARETLDEAPDTGQYGDDRPSEVHLSQTMGGRWILSGDLTLEDGAILAQGIQHASTELFHAGTTTSDGAAFTPAQRRGRALVELQRKGMSAGPDDRPPHPLLMAVVDVERLIGPVTVRPAERVEVLRGATDQTLLDGPLDGGRFHRAEDAPTLCSVGPPNDVRTGFEPSPPTTSRRGSSPPDGPRRVLSDEYDEPVRPHLRLPAPPTGSAHRGDSGLVAPDVEALGRCEIVGAGPVPRATLQRLACDGAIRRVLVDAAGEILDVGRARRLATSAQRAGLIVRDGGCVFPGCDCPYGWCEAHHLIPFEQGGATDLDNLALLCRHHHHLVHEGRWVLARRRRLGRDQPDGSPDRRLTRTSGELAPGEAEVTWWDAWRRGRPRRLPVGNLGA